MSAKGFCSLFPAGETRAFSDQPREEVSLQTLEGACSRAYSSALQIELGTACGKLFRCSTMAILDAGDSDILNDQQA